MYREQIEPLQDMLLQKNAALSTSQEALLQTDHSLADARAEASALKEELQSAQARLEEREAALHALADELAHCKSVIAAQEEAIISQEKKAFFRWLAGRDRDLERAAAYNPLFHLSGKLANVRDRLSSRLLLSSASVPIPVTWGSNCLIAGNVDTGTLTEILEKPYQKYDVLIFSVINYHFRYQRPQQIADHYAKRGHRVFYINAGFIHSLTPTVEQKGNLYIVPPTISARFRSATPISVFRSTNPTKASQAETMTASLWPEAIIWFF